MSGTYLPPLGGLGRNLDEVLMRKVARATVKDLAASIAERLDQLIVARRKQQALPNLKREPGRTPTPL